MDFLINVISTLAYSTDYNSHRLYPIEASSMCWKDQRHDYNFCFGFEARIKCYDKKNSVTKSVKLTTNLRSLYHILGLVYV